MADVSQIELNNVTYNICDATARNSLSQFVSKTGDTVTGNIIRKHSNIDLTEAPESNQYEYNILARDKNDQSIGYFQVYQTTANSYGIINYALKRWDDTNHYAGFSAGFSTANDAMVDIRADYTNFGNGEVAVFGSKTPNRTAPFLTIGGGLNTPGTVDGTAIRLGAGGLTLIGAGEYATSRYNVGDLSDLAESLFLGADGNVMIETNGNTIADRKTFVFASSGIATFPGVVSAKSSNLSINTNNTDTNAITGNSGYYLYDSNTIWGGRLALRNVGSSGGNGILLEAHRDISNTPKYNSLLLKINADGNPSVWVTDAAAWRSGLGITPANIGALATTGGTVSGSLKLTRTTDTAGTANNQPALMIGDMDGLHLEFDGNEIMAKATDTTVGTLNLNIDGGNVVIGKSGGTQTINLNGTGQVNGNTIYHTGNIPTWNQNTTGNAATATKLATARNLYVALGTAYNSSSPVTFDGSAAKALPVNGILTTAHGGTGNANGTVAKLTTAREIYVALGSTRNSESPVTFDGSAAKAIHVSGTLPIARGGTGKTSAADAWTALGGKALGKKDSISLGRTTASCAESYTINAGKTVLVNIKSKYEYMDNVQQVAGRVMTGAYGWTTGDAGVGLVSIDYDQVRLRSDKTASYDGTLTAKYVYCKSSLS